MSALKTFSLGLLSLFTALTASRAQNIVLTNDDGWAVAQIRAQFEALEAHGYDVILSAPAQDQSGTGTSSATPTPLTEPCEFDSCPVGSPAQGFNASDVRLNYVNSFPVDSVKYGIKTLAPQFWGGAKPELVVSGPNVGLNTEFSVFGSGTVGAACEAAIEGVPAIAFSGTTARHEAWTALMDSPTSSSVLAARNHADLAVRLVSALFAQPPSSSLLPSGVILNVNFPADASCPADDVQFVFTRVFPALLPIDVHTCNNGGKLPAEDTVVHADGCFASVSVVDATLHLDVLEPTQKDVLKRLDALGFACFSK